MSDEIRKALDITPFVEERKPAILEAEDDFDFARKNLLDVIGKAQGAVEDMTDVARQSQSARAYEVLNNMLKTIGDLSRDLLEVQQRRQDMMQKEVPANPTEIHNHLNITTSDLAKMIEDAKRPKDE